MRPRGTPIDGREAIADNARRQRRSYAVILGIFLFLLGVALIASWGAIKIVDSTRAYVTGEGRYSKAEKIAVLSLHRYAYSGQPADYARFLAAAAIPRGDRVARQAMLAPTMDIAAAKRGFLLGENHPDDIAGMINLFRWFSWWRPFAEAVADWRGGDALVVRLVTEGAQLHRLVAAGNRDMRPRTALLDRIDRIDDALTDLENRFSAHLGDAARSATALVVVVLSAMTILLWSLGTIYAARLLRRQLALDRRLASSERRFRDFAEVASDWYWEMDARNTVTYISERFGEMIGRAAHTVLDHDGAAFVRDRAVNEEHRQLYVTALAEQREFRGIQVQRFDAQGRARYWSISGKPYRDAQGQFLGYRGVGSDVTDAVEYERTLQDAKARAESANRAKSEFLANMSHELRTPLNAILGFSDIIGQQMFGPDAVDRYSDYARDIHKSGDHLLEIIDDILDLSKIEAGRAQLADDEVALSKLAGMMVTLLGARFAEAGIEFRVELPDIDPVIRVDERKFSQIFINLLSNALKFTPRGGSVTLAAAARDDGDFALSVCDTGIGIAASDLATVLAPFGQVESAFSRKHHGTGLGLPLAKSIAELHGGTLRLESTPHVGTTATIVLPADRVVGMLDPGRTALGA